MEAEIESLGEWRDQDSMFVSIGTGTSPGESLLGNRMDLAKKLSKIVTDTEQTNQDFLSQHLRLEEDGGFFRFNVNDGSMAGIGLEEHEEAPQIATNTYTYLQNPVVEQSVAKCTESLLHGGQRLGFASSHGTSTE